MSKHSWIPSIFHVSDDGLDVRIKSYINGLGPRDRFPILYALIEKVFLLALPHFERTLDFQHGTGFESPSGELDDLCCLLTNSDVHRATVARTMRIGRVHSGGMGCMPC
jgi:hypothetical protein